MNPFESETDCSVAAAASATVLAGLGFVHLEAATLVILAVQGTDGSSAFIFVGHFDEAEATWPSGFTIGDEIDFVHRAVSREEFANIAFLGVEGEIADIDIEHQTVS